MGIDPANLTERQRELMRPTDREELGLQAPGATRQRKAEREDLGIDAFSERHQRRVKRLERDEQHILAGWLFLREQDGALVYDWSRTDRRTTNRKGMPDFRIYAKGFALLGEMKLERGKPSPEQLAMMEKFRRSGTEVQLWYSAAEAIEAIRDWLISRP